MRRLSSTIKFKKWINNRDKTSRNLDKTKEVVGGMTDHSNREGMARETISMASMEAVTGEMKN